MFMFMVEMTDISMSSTVAWLSPSQAEPNLPIPAKELREMTMVLFLFLVNQRFDDLTWVVPKRE